MRTVHLTRAEEQIVFNSDIQLVKDSLALHFKEVDYQNWYKAQSDAYYKLFPITRVMTKAEKVTYDTENFTKNNPKPKGFTYPKVTIDYSKDSTFITLDEYINETIVVTPAVAEVPAVFDVNGLITTPAVPAVAEVTKRVREFTPKANYTTEVDTYLANSTEYKERLKKEKIQKLNTLKVTANTVLYDANGRAVGNMASVVSLANWQFNKLLSLGKTATVAYKTVYKDTLVNWRGADNVVHNVQVESICEALNNSMLEIAKVIGV